MGGRPRHRYGTGMMVKLIRMELKDEAAARAVDAVAEKNTAAVQELEPGTLMYVMHTVEDAPLSRVVYELFADPDARAQHDSADYLKRALVELEPYVESWRVEYLGVPIGKLPGLL